MTGRQAGIFVAALLLFTGCSNTGREQAEISTVLATRAAALNSKNITRYLSVISPQYSDKGKGFGQLKESLEKNFRDSVSLAYEAGTPSIVVHGNTAEATGTYRMKVKIHEKEVTLNGTEHLKLAKEPTGWKIIAGI